MSTANGSSTLPRQNHLLIAAGADFGDRRGDPFVVAVGSDPHIDRCRGRQVDTLRAGDQIVDIARLVRGGAADPHAGGIDAHLDPRNHQVRQRGQRIEMVGRRERVGAEFEADPAIGVAAVDRQGRQCGVDGGGGAAGPRASGGLTTPDGAQFTGVEFHATERIGGEHPHTGLARTSRTHRTDQRRPDVTSLPPGRSRAPPVRAVPSTTTILQGKADLTFLG